MKRLNIGDIVNILQGSVFTFIEGNYVTKKSKLHFRCNKGHDFISQYHHIRLMIRNGGCTKCRGVDNKNYKWPIGKTIGRLTIVSNLNTTDKKEYLKLKCECGRIVYRRPSTQIMERSSCNIGACFAELIDHTGKIYGFLTVVKRVNTRKEKEIISYICNCSCGKQIVRQAPYFSMVKVPSCGCSYVGKNSKDWNGYGDIPGRYFTQAKTNAISRNIFFDISIEFLDSLYSNQNKRCSLTGLPIDFGFETKRKLSGIRNITASLDRIDSAKGYIEGNVQWVHKDVNTMKMDFSEDRFIEICSLVSKKYGKSNVS